MAGILDYLGFEYKMIPDDTDANGLMELFADECERGRKEGFTPVIIPLEDNLDEYFEDMDDDVSGHFEQRGAAGLFSQREHEYEDDIDELMSDVTTGDVSNTLVSVFDYESGEIGESAIVYLPTDKPWEAAFLVPFGGWNECPEPEDMAAVLKYWFEIYGAVPAAITHDTLEMVVPDAIPREKALALAREHYLFCPDRVTQCTRTGKLGELAGDLSVSKVWYFWWD